jgi:hypothetical protein
MALRNHPRLVAGAIGAPALVVGIALSSNAGTGAGNEPSPAPETSTCADPGYSRAELMNVVHAYRRSAAAGRITLRGIDQGRYWSSYDRCESH